MASLLSPEDEFIGNYEPGPYVSAPIYGLLSGLKEGIEIPGNVLSGEYGYYGDLSPISDDPYPQTFMERIDDPAAQFAGDFLMLPALAGSTAATIAGQTDNVLMAGSGDPMNFSRLIRHEPITDTNVTVIPSNRGLLSEKVITLDDLRGGTVIPFVGDKTAAGGMLTEIDGVPLAYGVKLEGGQDFMRDVAAQVDNSIWASHQSVIDPMYKVAQEIAQDTGKPVYGAFVNMANVGQDFSTMTADALVAQLPSSQLTKSAIKEFNKAMKSINKKGDFAVDDFPGIDAPLMKLRDYIVSAPPKVRKKFVQTMDTGKFKKLGFPDVGKTRYAITQPRLRSVPENMTGMNIGRIDTDAGVLYDPTTPHNSYNTHILGEYVGRLENPIPMDFLFQNRLLQDPDIAGRGLLPQTLRNSLAYSPRKSAQPLDDLFYFNLDRLMKGQPIQYRSYE